MPTLKSLKKEIDKGATVVQEPGADGFTSVEKIGRKYYWTYSNTEHELYDTWGELYENAEPHADAFTDEELDNWRIFTPAYVGARVTLALSDEEHDAIDVLKKRWNLNTSQVIRRSLLEQAVPVETALTRSGLT